MLRRPTRCDSFSTAVRLVGWMENYYFVYVFEIDVILAFKTFTWLYMAIIAIITFLCHVLYHFILQKKGAFDVDFIKRV